MINLVEFEAASLESETLVKEMVTAARAPAGEPVPELRAEDETLISIMVMLPLPNHVYTSWDLAQRVALSSPMVLQWCEVVDDGELLGWVSAVGKDARENLVADWGARRTS